MEVCDVRRLTRADHADVAAVLADDGGYALRVHGRPLTDADVEDVFTARPPDTTAEQKRTLGLWEDGTLVGVADLVTDVPESGTNHLGLLQLRADCHGRGLARLFHERILAMFPTEGRWRLSVVDTNREVVGFWERLGYRLTGETRPWTSPSGEERLALLMERPGATAP